MASPVARRNRNDPNTPIGSDRMTASGRMKLSYCPTSTRYTNATTIRKM